MKVETTKELVLKAANENPGSKKLLTTMFPSVFEDTSRACAIGSVFFRQDYPNNVYAVVKKNGNEIIIMNVTHSTTWGEKERIYVSHLFDPNQSYITIDEFKKLTGYNDMSKFIFVPITMNCRLKALAEEIANR
jgi:hypothetical protein